MSRIRHWLWGSNVRRQLVVGVVLVHALLMTLFVFDLVRREHEFAKERSEAHVEFQAQMLASSSAYAVMSNDLAGLSDILVALRNDKDLNYAIVTDTRGRILAHTDPSKVGLYRSDHSAILAGAPRSSIIQESNSSIEAVSPIIVRGKVIGWAWVMRDLRSVQKYLAYITYAGMAYTATALLIGTFFAFLLTRIVTRQLRMLLAGLNRVAANQLDEPVPVVTDNEIGYVTRAFNEAMQKLRDQQDALREGEARFSKVFHTRSIGINIFRLSDSRCVDVNETYLDIVGYPREEVIGHTAAELNLFVDPESRNVWMKQLREHGRVLNQDAKIRRKSGEVRDVLASIDLIDVHGESMGLIIATDITERKRVAEELQESQEKLALFIEHAPAALAMFDRDMRYLSVSHRYLFDYNLGARDLRGLIHYEIFPEIGDAWKQAHRRCLAGEVLRSEGDRFERANGTVQWLRWELRPWYTAQGAVGGIVLFTEDITERKHIDRELRQKDERLRRVIESMTEGLVIAHENGNKLTWNRAAIEMHHFTGDAEWERSLPDFQNLFELSLPGNKVLPFDQWPIFRVLHGASLRNCEVHIRRKDKNWERIFSYGGMSIADDDGQKIAFVTITDVTERNRAEEEIRKLNTELELRVAARTAELEFANKELESFSYSVSHDLRAPLRAIDGFAQAVMEDYGPTLPPEGQEYLRTICRGAKRMGDLIDDLLAFSRLGRQPLSRLPVDVRDLVSQCLDDLRPAYKDRSIDFQVAVLPPSLGDRALLKQVWINLLSNAIKFTGRRQHASVQIGVQFNDGKVVYFIRDNGAGFDMRYADKLFGVFQRLHRNDEFEGTGVGLAIVQRIVHRHGGRIWAESELDRGATFYFTVEEGTGPS